MLGNDFLCHYISFTVNITIQCYSKKLICLKIEWSVCIFLFHKVLHLIFFNVKTYLSWFSGTFKKLLNMLYCFWIITTYICVCAYMYISTWYPLVEHSFWFKKDNRSSKKIYQMPEFKRSKHHSSQIHMYYFSKLVINTDCSMTYLKTGGNVTYVGQIQTVCDVLNHYLVTSWLASPMKFHNSTRHLFLGLERGRTALQHSHCKDGTLVPGWEKRPP